MKRLLISILLATALVSSLSAQGLVELFQKAKEQVKAGSWTSALSTLDALDAEGRKEGFESASCRPTVEIASPARARR